MSPTFKRKARKLGKTFNEMWAKIPFDTKCLMCGNIHARMNMMNQGLTDKGVSLKLGLQYLKKLGSVSQPKQQISEPLDENDPLYEGKKIAALFDNWVNNSKMLSTDLPDVPL